MLTFVTIVHVLLCVFMIFVILLQPGKDAGMGAALGGGAATSAFGGRGAVTFLSKVTAVCAALFFLTSLGLSFAGLKSSVAPDATPAATTPPSSLPVAIKDAGTEAAIPTPKAEGIAAPVEGSAAPTTPKEPAENEKKADETKKEEPPKQ